MRGVSDLSRSRVQVRASRCNISGMMAGGGPPSTPEFEGNNSQGSEAMRLSIGRAPAREIETGPVSFWVKAAAQPWMAAAGARASPSRAAYGPLGSVCQS
jgi:hypothetical protein